LNNSTGNNFFAGNNAKNIQLNKNLKDDYTLISTSSAQNTIGDGSIAQEIANIRSTIDAETGRSIDDNYQILVTNISIDGNKENFISQNQDKIITQLRAQKASYSGVSLDEEMTNLLKYERAYQAAAKVAQAVDEIMKTILQLV
jgi:flagellar hook-associated protein 1 FlgK